LILEAENLKTQRTQKKLENAETKLVLNFVIRHSCFERKPSSAFSAELSAFSVLRFGLNLRVPEPELFLN